MEFGFLENFSHLLPDKKVVVYKEYKVRKGDSLYKIAKKFQTTVSSIREANKLNKKSRIVYGKTLLVPKILPYSVNIVRLVTPPDIPPEMQSYPEMS